MPYLRNIFLVALIAAVMMTSGGGVFAFESSSASFEIHAGDVESITGTSTSANFGEHNAGGQNAVGTSTSANFSDCSGVLCWLMSWFTARYDQIHYRWRNDDGSEVAATWAVTPEDTQYSNFQKNVVKRLRFEISNEGWTRGADPTFQLEVAETTTCASGSYAAVPTNYSGHWHLATTTNPLYFTNGDPTTDVAGITDENGVFVAGRIQDTSNTTVAIHLTSSDYTYVEFGVMALNAATAGGTYCFRLTNSGSTTNFNYSQYAKAVFTSGLTFGSLTSSIFDTGVANGAAYNSITWIGALLGGKVRLKIATSNSAGGPWNYVGAPPTCSTTEPGTDADWFVVDQNLPQEIKCFSTHNNKRYFRYKVQLCAESTCAASGGGTPRVDDVIISWSP